MTTETAEIIPNKEEPVLTEKNSTRNFRKEQVPFLKSFKYYMKQVDTFHSDIQKEMVWLEEIRAKIVDVYNMQLIHIKESITQNYDKSTKKQRESLHAALMININMINKRLAVLEKQSKKNEQVKAYDTKAKHWNIRRNMKYTINETYEFLPPNFFDYLTFGIFWVIRTRIRRHLWAQKRSQSENTSSQDKTSSEIITDSESEPQLKNKVGMLPPTGEIPLPTGTIPLQNNDTSIIGSNELNITAPVLSPNASLIKATKTGVGKSYKELKGEFDR